MKNLYQSSSGGKPRIKVLADGDMVLELFINRSGFVENAEELLKEVTQSEWVEVYITDKCIRRVRSELGTTDSKLGEQAAAYIEAMFNERIIFIDSALKEQGRKSPLRDFDSAEEVACATALNFNAIITQNPQNFDETTLPIWSVSELLQRQNLINLKYAEAAKMLMPLRGLHIGRQAKDKMVQSNLHLVVSIAMKYMNRGLPLQDLIEEGNLGLICAADKFDHEKGYKFSTYAIWYIRQAIIRALTD